MSVVRDDHVAQLEAKYRSVVGPAERLAGHLSVQIGTILDTQKVPLAFPIQHRVKKWDSIAEKFTRVRLQIAEPTDLQDLVGLRIVVLFRRDVESVAVAIRTTLRVIREYDTSDRLKADQFGYSSKHLVVALPEAWLGVPTFVGLGEFVAEIQLRTLSQHMWAEASQYLQYKREEAVPVTIRRALYRGSAILETVDLEFDRILVERAEYREALNRDSSDAALNVDLLEKTLDATLPTANKDTAEGYGAMLEELQHFGVGSVDKLQTLIAKRLKRARAEERKELSRVQKEIAAGQDPLGTSVERTERGVFFTHCGLLRMMIQSEVGRDAHIAYWRAKQPPLQPPSAVPPVHKAGPKKRHP